MKSKTRKYYYKIFFIPVGKKSWSEKKKDGITYIIAVSKYAAIRQAKLYADTTHMYHLDTLKRISKYEYNKAHTFLQDNE